MTVLFTACHNIYANSVEIGGRLWNFDSFCLSKADN